MRVDFDRDMSTQQYIANLILNPAHLFYEYWRYPILFDLLVITGRERQILFGGVIGL